MQYIEKFMQLIHAGTFCVYWLFYLGYIFILLYLSRHQEPNGKPVRYLLILGAAALTAGILYAPLTLIPFIWTIPIAIKKLIGRKDNLFYNYLYCAIIPVLLLVMNRTWGLL